MKVIEKSQTQEIEYFLFWTADMQSVGLVKLINNKYFESTICFDVIHKQYPQFEIFDYQEVAL